MEGLHDPDLRRLARLTTVEIAAIEKSDALVVLPIGAVEQHGPHLPCDTDIRIAEAVTDRAVAACPAAVNVWTLPSQAYGKSNEHVGFPGTMSLSTTTFLAVCSDLGRSVARSGFRKLAFVNGHGGQPQLLEVAARDIREDTGLEVFPLFVHRLGRPDDLPDRGSAPFELHGGVVETSVMLALDPETVDTDRFDAAVDDRAESFTREHELISLEGDLPVAWLTRDLSATGAIGDPAGASAADGERFLGNWAATLARAFAEICRLRF